MNAIDGVVIFIMFYSILMISLIDCIESLQKRTKTEYRLRRRVKLRRGVVRRRSSKESTIVSPAVRVVESAEENLLKEDDEKIVCVERDPEGQEITENLNREDSRGLDTRSLTYGEYSCEKLGAFDRKSYFSGIVANNGDYVRTQNLVMDQELDSRGGFSGISENNVDGNCESSGIIDQESDSCSECSGTSENSGDESDSCSECSGTSENNVDDICENSGIIEDDNNSNGEGEEEFVDDWEGIETTELEKSFGEALVFASSKSNSDRIGDLKLQLYGLQKVALDGPCHESPPMAFKISARSKWNAWQKLGSMSRETAMEMYVDVLSKAIPTWKGEDNNNKTLTIEDESGSSSSKSTSEGALSAESVSGAENGPVTEDEIRAFYSEKAQQQEQMTALDLVLKFKSRLMSRSERYAFLAIIARICRLHMTPERNYVVLKGL
ncbi:hypothetical protein ABFS83_12G017700 [Erythranthe nasuta]